MLNSQKRTIKIKGAGIAGLASAIILADQNFRVKVFEKNKDVGLQRSGDYEGLENWTDKEDILDYLKKLAIKIDFWHKPIYKTSYFSYDGDKFDFKTEKPLIYMIKRGNEKGCLDYALKHQAIKNGVEIIFGEKVEDDLDIDSSGAKRANALGYGVTFDTSSDNVVSALLDDEAAPYGYSYLITLNGKGTLVTAFFKKPFGNAKRYFQKTEEKFEKYYKGLDIKNPKVFGHFVNFSILKNKHKILIGEAAGIQDYLFGFGMRLAIKSAELAALAISENKDYYALYKKKILPFLKAGIVNRFLYEKLKSKGYKKMLERFKGKDIRKILQKSYRFSLVHRFVYPLARTKFKNL